MTTPEFDPLRSALLLMDFQSSIVDGYGGDPGLLDRTSRVLETARTASMRVVHVRVAFRPGYPEVSPRNMRFSTLRESGRLRLGDAGSEIHPALAPRDGEPVVTKHRVGAFTGTELDMMLRAQGVEALVLCGIATSGVVLSTLRTAADLDYRCIIVADCCADQDAEVHAVLTGKVFPRQAVVTDAAALLTAFQSA
jgi:nicotinamidase-related amidase